ncbi:vitamin K epoxide reductase family protein [Mucilaginibacter sp. McL0603]|uniref:vitamin K epoxide reductase family protein n=1 Tax=Mucilaginibacter sp. McL0603 TaxID=3415670 RepID=UPI003CEA3AE3
MEKKTASGSSDGNQQRIGFLKFSSLALIIAGTIISGYLFYRHNIITGVEAAAKPDVCSSIFGKGCDNALKSSVSYILGLPLAAWGIIYYLTLAIFVAVKTLAGNLFKKEAMAGIFILTLTASVASLTLLALMLFIPTLFCPLCTVIHAINLLLFFSMPKAIGYSYSQFLKFRPANSEYQNNSYFKDLTRKKIIGISMFVLTISAFYFDLRQIAAPNGSSPDAPAQPLAIINEFKSQHQENIPIDSDDPVLGSAHSPVQLVVFSDLTCPGCRYFSRVLAALSNKNGGGINIVFKHFPLGTACNPLMTKDLHPRACEAALAAEAARRQGKFWSFHNELFATDLNNIHKTVSLIALKLNLNTQRFENDRVGDSAISKVKRNIDLAIRLGVSATPTVFLDGRRVNDIRFQSLQILINYELQRTGLATTEISNTAKN